MKQFPLAVYSALLTALSAVLAVVLYVKTDDGLWAVLGAALAAVAAVGGVIVHKVTAPTKP
jgi:hypothetical protein